MGSTSYITYKLEKVERKELPKSQLKHQICLFVNKHKKYFCVQTLMNIKYVAKKKEINTDQN